jgi:hypothetical protein
VVERRDVVRGQLAERCGVEVVEEREQRLPDRLRKR